MSQDEYTEAFEAGIKFALDDVLYAIDVCRETVCSQSVLTVLLRLENEVKELYRETA